MKCPNCGAEIGRFDLSQNCKNCGVNLFYVNQEELLTRDVKRTELEFAAFRMLVSRLKTAFIKGPLPISRIVFTVLSVAALLIPFATVKLSFPFYSGKLSFGGIGIYQAYSDGALMSLFDYLKIDAAKGTALRSVILTGIIALAVIAALGVFVTEILSFTNIRKTAKVMAGFAFAGTAFSLAAGIFSFVFGASVPGNIALFVSASAGAGGFVAAAMFAALAVINILFVKKKIEPEFNETDIKRRDMNRKVKKGEVSLDDLPCPVFEEEEVAADGE